jgi:UDP-N-acetylglucosamine 2-epimerase (non-hydrolysing)
MSHNLVTNPNNQKIDVVPLLKSVNDSPSKKVLTLFGTRPEIIKLAPVISELESRSNEFQTINVSSDQHTNLLQPFVKLFDVRVDYNLNVMHENQTPNEIFARVLMAMNELLKETKPDVVLVQGDTTTALAGAMSAFYLKIPVGHIEAGLRSGNTMSPFPEEMNRRLITQVASFHFAGTEGNRTTLLSEGIGDEKIFVTGNPVVDSLQWVLERACPSERIENLILQTKGLKRIILTTHRRESFGEKMSGNLVALRNFVEEHEDVALLFPVHLNPHVVETAYAYLDNHPRIRLIEPLGYQDFVSLLSNAWLIVSDSGGVQEEAPTLGKPLLILRENTERPEAIAAGIAKLVGGNPETLKQMLDEVYSSDEWARHVKQTPNPFGDGKAAKRIADTLSFKFQTNNLELET